MFPVSAGILAQNEQNIGLGWEMHPRSGGEAEANNSKALSEQGQQHRAQGKAWGGITAEGNSPGPNWGYFNPFMDKYRVWERVTLVSPAITREEG